ncbi:glycosyltransferase family 4 protein [Mucilaginibacter aquatilis]|uniref:Glycosyltransferase n=1 Tax=Mucilaginibacter aquatilis TaxID=1517760 RepID=A0A6I4IC06_9SPHI|nr:glycosyltransferase family 4 protein [Mucilaginibacter aquatilis]MVN92775.1 glycosyltransferase [Mucilaginibacter aquatilis]
MKILFLSYKFYPDVGGIETMSDVVCNALHARGYEIKVVTTSAANAATQNRDYPVIRNPSKMQLLKLHFWADLVFENNPSLNLSWPNLLSGKPLVVALHTWIARVDGQKGIQDKLKQFWLKKAESVIACSKAIALACHPGATVIPNPYNDDLFKVKPEIRRDKKFVFLGRLVSDKGAIIALKAFHGFITKSGDTNATLTIIGQGPELESLQREAQNLQIDGKVFFEGTKKGEALVDTLNQHQYMLIPSVWEEPFGLVALEGMACGCIPVASNSGGLSEAVGKGGILFEKGNVDDLVAKLLNLENDQQLKQTLLQNGVEHLNLHKQAYVMDKYVHAINQALNK